MIERFRKVEFEIKFLNLIKKEVITDLELIQGTEKQLPDLYKQYLELIQTGVLWTSKINSKLNINSPVIAFQMGGYIVSEVFLTAFGTKAAGLGYAYKDLYKTKITE